MFKKSRIKIVAYIMSVLVLLLAGTLCIIYYTSYMDVYRQDQTMLERYVMVGRFKNNDKDGNIDGNITDKDGNIILKGDRQGKRFNNEHAFLLSTFYSVTFSADGEVKSIDNNEDSVYSDDELTQLAVSLISDGSAQGTSESLVYRIERNEEYILVAFMDNTIVRQSITTLFQYTFIFGSVAIIIIFFLSIYLAKRIVAPLEESYKKQKQFISDAGHELKTPVSVVSTNAEMLSREIGENQWLSNIQFENNRMAILIKQLMELAKTDNVVPSMERVNFSRVVVGELLPFESVAFEKGLELSYDSVAENVFVHGNAEQLGQLVSILLDNAVTHSSEHGTVTVSLSVKHGKAYLSVTNKGPEIPKEQCALIFERFYRTDFSRTGEDNHYGLGLAIAKSIITSHHGEIGVSCENGYVTFCASLPTKNA
ncbi:MAG: sensor histidine kinase [Acutalibacteraceae bacterium]